jgi:hypothetical protein
VANAWLSCTSAGCTWTVAPPGLPAPAAALCDDGNPCTQNDVCSGKTCSAGANVCACTTNTDCPDDGDACNGQPYCDKSGPIWSCKNNPASVVTCSTSADTPCAKAQCDPQSGDCKPVPTEVLTGGPVACTDGNSCTSGDQCQGGACVAGTETCKCQSDADCDSQEDGNACNGTLFCNKASGACQLNPATVVVCPTVDDTNCGHNVCYPKSGLCQLAPVEVTEQVCTGTDCRWQLLPPGSDAGEITACDDGNSCTVGEKCSGGACIASVDTCLCQNDSDCAKFDDGDACNGTQYCNLLEQKCALNPASIVPCQTVGDTACLQNACEPTTGQCSPTPVGKVATVCVDLPGGKQCLQEVKADAETLNLPCDDGNACTEGDTCQAGQCQSGAKVCLCQTDSDCLAGEDGDRCNGTLYCDKLSGDCKLNPATVIACASGQNTTCQKIACHPITGQCLATPTELTREVCDADKCLTEVDLSGDLTVTLGCEDGEPCTTGDLCNGGQCQPGVFTCACNTTADCAKKEDGNVCNGTLFCDKSVFGSPQCALNPATILTCPASTVPCGVAACDPNSGACSVVPGNDGKPCDDGTLCTEADACSSGQCGGLAVDCNDNNACTNDTCQSGLGCVHVGKSCDDGNVCTLDGCDGQTGQCTADTLAKDGALCNADASGCTVNDFCAAGTCKAGAPIACSQPAGPCEQAVCVPQGDLGYACQNVVKPSGSVCDDGDDCTTNSGCDGLTCKALGGERHFVREYAPTGRAHGRVISVAAYPGGGALAVGSAWDGDANLSNTAGVSNTAWWAIRVDASGSEMWQALLPTDATSTAAELRYVQWGNGSWRLAGTLAVAGGDHNMAAVQLTDNGSWGSVQQYGLSNQNEYLLDADLDGQGILTLFGTRRPTTGVWSTVLAQLLPSGSWGPAYVDANDYRRTVIDVVRLANGYWVLTLVGKDASTQAADSTLVQWWSTSGPTGTERLWGDGVTAQSGNQLATDGTRVMVAGHRSATSDGARMLLSATGALTWQTFGAEKNVELFGLGWQGANNWVVAGRVLPAGESEVEPYLFATDDFGNVQWSATEPGLSGGRWYRVAVDPGLGFFASGVRSTASKTSAIVGHYSPWGQSTCATAGMCKNLAATACDDGQTCTVDYCDGATGCKTSVTNGLRCDPGDSCSTLSTCAAGSCTGTEFGRLWEITPHSPNASMNQIVAIGQGRYAIAGTTDTAAAIVQCSLRVVTATGSAVMSGVYNLNNWYDHFQDMHRCDLAATSDGGFVLAMFMSRTDKTSTPDTRYYRRNIKFNSNGVVQWNEFLTTETFPVGQFGTYGRTDGSYVVLTTGSAIQEQTANYVIDYANPTSIRYQVRLNGTSSPFWTGSYNTTTAIRGAIGVQGSNGDWVVGSRYVSAGGDRMFAVRFKVSVGNQVTNNNVSGIAASTTVEIPRAILAESDGGVLILWSISNNYYLSKLDSAGKRLWTRSFPATSTEQEQPQAMARRSDGSLVFAGRRRLNTALTWQVQHRSPSFAQLSVVTHTSGSLQGIALTPDAFTDVLVVGNKSGTSTISRMSPWGHRSCTTAGSCKGLTLANCIDTSPCTADGCNTASGCSFAALSGEACEDGDACSVSDVCAGDGSCAGTPITSDGCDDANGCTIDLCDPASGCEHYPTVDAPCDDGNACSTEDVCSASGVCAGVVTSAGPCEDNDTCTSDICLTGGSCSHVVLSGATCDDGEACTADDVCGDDGACAGSPIDGCQ